MRVTSNVLVYFGEDLAGFKATARNGLALRHVVRNGGFQI
jgi:hypothetical protein